MVAPDGISARELSRSARVALMRTSRIDMVEPLAVDEEQGQALLRRQVAEEARRQVVDLRTCLFAEEKLEARVVSLRLAHGIGMAAQLGQPMPIELGEGPAIERRAPLVAVLLGEHALKRPAEECRAFLARAHHEAGKTLQPRQHGNEAWPYGVVEFLCLHLIVPAAWVSAGRAETPYANQ
jgi:hypothetical protein